MALDFSNSSTGGVASAFANGTTQRAQPIIQGGQQGQGSVAAAFSHPSPQQQVAITPDANGLLPGQTKFFTPSPGATEDQVHVFQSVDPSLPPDQRTLVVSRPALAALQAAPANNLTLGGGNGQGSGGKGGGAGNTGLGNSGGTGLKSGGTGGGGGGAGGGSPAGGGTGGGGLSGGGARGF